jgi:hypothetical protein
MGLLSKAAVKTEPPTGAEAAVRPLLEAFAQANDSFHVIVLQADAHALSGMTESVGSVFDLGGGKCLLLMRPSADCELVMHRLSKSLNAETLCQLKADSAETALSAIASFL